MRYKILDPSMTFALCLVTTFVMLPISHGIAFGVYCLKRHALRAYHAKNGKEYDEHIDEKTLEK